MRVEEGGDGGYDGGAEPAHRCWLEEGWPLREGAAGGGMAYEEGCDRADVPCAQVAIELGIHERHLRREEAAEEEEGA